MSTPSQPTSGPTRQGPPGTGFAYPGPIPHRPVPGGGFAPGASGAPGSHVWPGGFAPAVPLGPGGAPLAEWWERLVAAVLDGLIVSAVLLVPVLALEVVFFLLVFNARDPEDVNGVLILSALLWILLIPLALAAYYVYFVPMMLKRGGQTIGKKAMKITIVRAADGGPIDFTTARRRWLVQYATSFTAPYFAYANGLWPLWDKPYRQSLADKAADTVVVKKPAA